jgi:hypothetical protein
MLASLAFVTPDPNSSVISKAVEVCPHEHLYTCGTITLPLSFFPPRTSIMLSVPGLEMLTRIGFAAQGIMYVVFVYLALRFGRSEDNAGALSYLAEGSGKFLLGVMALGFVAYGIWRLSAAVIDTEGHGAEPKGAAAHLGGGLSGLIHIGLALVAVRLALSKGGGGSGGAQDGAATALSLPGGTVLVTLPEQH